MKKYLLIFLLLNYSKAAELVVFNVGQGNCNLFVPDQKISNGTCIPILYDAGSDHYPQDENQCKVTKTTVIKEIVTKICSVLPNIHPTLNVVIGHGDTDHYSYILEVLNKLPKEVTFYFFLGGSQSQYADNFIKQIMNYPKSRKKSLFFANDEQKENPSIGTPYFCEILSWLNTTNKNTNSVVLKISLVNAFSILLTGDATKDTTSKIKSQDIEQTSILLANHHGAETEGSNSESWVKNSNPQIVVFSCSRTKNGHPRSIVVNRYLQQASRLCAWPIHEFSYTGKTINIPSSFSTYHTEPEQTSQQKYFHAIIRKALFNTMNEGTLRFCLTSPIKIEQPKFYFSMFPFQHLTTINLNAILMTNEEFIIIVPKLHVLLLLAIANFDDNSLLLTLKDGKKMIETLQSFLTASKQLQSISFKNNTIDADAIQTVVNDTEYFTKLKLK
jgi:beta-lactamase superfamily II metal-dependent hydrolase